MNIQIDEKMMSKCKEWIDYDGTEIIRTIITEDDGDWHKRVYLIQYEGYDAIEIMLLRLFTPDNGENILVSGDYQNVFPKTIDNLLEYSNALVRIAKD